MKGQEFEKNYNASHVPSSPNVGKILEIYGLHLKYHQHSILKYSFEGFPYREQTCLCEIHITVE